MSPGASGSLFGMATDGGNNTFSGCVAVTVGLVTDTWYDFLDAIKPHPGARDELQLSRAGRALTRAVTLNSQEEKNPITGEESTVGQVGIFRPSDDYTYTRVSPSEAVVAE